MADNFDFTEGSGKTGAADEVSGVLYPRVKLDLGTDGVAAPALAGAGAVATGVQRVTLASDDPAVALLGTIDTDTGNMVTALQLLDNAIDGNYFNCNINIAGTDCIGGAGAVAAGVQRITLASDDPAVALLGTMDTDTGNIVTALQLLDNAVYVDDADWTDNTSSHLLVGGIYQSTDHTVTDGDVSPFQVDVNGCIVLGTGAKAIGKLTANSGVDIGDIDVTSIIPLTGATNLGKARDVACGANDVGVMALAVRDDALTTLTPADGDYVPLRVSSTGQLHVTGAGGGTEYTEDDAAPANPVGKAMLAERDDALGGLTPAAGDWTHLFCDANGALWVHDNVVNTLLGTIDTDTGNMVTALQLLDNAVDGNFLNCNMCLAGNDAVAGEGVIDSNTLRVTIATDDDGVVHLATIADWDATHASAAPADGVQVMGAAYSTALPADVGADADAARICTDRHGRIVRGLMPQWFIAVFDSADASAEANIVKAKTAARKIYILSLTISVDAEMWVKLQDEDSNAITCKHWFKAGGGKTITYPPEAPLVLNVVNKDLEVITEGAGNIGVEITGYLAV